MFDNNKQTKEKKMKKCLWAGMLAVGLTMSSMSSAYYIDNHPGGDYDGVDVGAVDTLLNMGNIGDDLGNSSPEAETAWVNGYLTFHGIAPVELGVSTGASIAYYDTSLVLGVSDELSDTIFAFGTIAPVDYFTIKQGNLIALFENNDAFDWGVFDTQYLIGMNLDDYEVSHWTKYGSTTTVPTPGTLWLFGTGLIGLIGFKRRANSNLNT